MRLSAHCSAVLGLAYVPPWTVNAGIVAGAERVLIIDTGATRTAAQTIHGYARALNERAEMLVANTERHLDHVSGNAWFAAQGCRIFGHPAIRRSEDDLREGAREWNACVTDAHRREAFEIEHAMRGTEIVNPDSSLEDGHVFELGGVDVRAVATPGHTITNFSFFVEKDRVMYTGDAVVTEFTPNTGEGGVEEWKQWLASLERIAAHRPTILVPGHGDVLRGDEISHELDRIARHLQRLIG